MSSVNGNSNQGADVVGISNRPGSLRHSVDFKYMSENAPETAGNMVPSQGNAAMSTPPKLQSSFSANDVPTVKNPGGASLMNNANNHAQQHFHNHNASLGRIPAGAVPRGHSRELSSDSNLNAGREQNNQYQSIQSALQASAAPFGPSATSAAPTSPPMVTSPNNAPMNSYASGYYPNNSYNSPPGASPAGNFGVQMLNGAMQQMNMNGVNGGNIYPPQNYTGYGSVAYNQNNQPRDSQARVIQHRRQLDNEG